MRRRLAIAAICAGVLLTSSLAQMHGGSRGGMGGAPRGGMSMGRGGFSSSGGVGFHGGSSFGGVTRGGFGTGFHQSFSGTRQTFVGFRRPFVGPRHFHSSYFYRSLYPYYFGYYGYPAYYGGYAYSAASYYPGYDYYGSSYATQYYGSSYYSAQNDIARQQADIDRLENEVARLREQRESGAPAPARTTTSNKAETSTPTLLVFRDKHTQEVQNYAVVDGTLWIFNAQRATKLPLSWLDIEATIKANDDRGVDFELPR